MADEAFELTNNLENLLSPFSYEPESALPKTIPEVPGGMYLSGFISQDCTWGCSFNHSVIKCFPVDRYFEDSHTSFAAHSSNASVALSSSSYTFAGGHITCAAELAIHNLRTSSGRRKLLLGISYTGDKNNSNLRGAVVLFDPIRCAPMKWIEIPDPVSSITILSHFEEGGSSRPFFNETMMAMVGIAAVGLRGGAVIIIDLGLDDPNLIISSTSDSRMASELTYRLLYVNPHEYVIATKRHKAVSKRSLIALRFTNEPEDEMIAEAFHYCKPSGESMLVLHKNSVAVTCLEYVPAIGSLLVGFTCGGFQIWRVNNMELQFSSEPFLLQNDEPVHVFGFSFQQPIDDPKNYCYIWVMYGNKSVECTNAHIELHSLYYERKKCIENFGFVYEAFRACAKRMSFPLLDDFLSTDSENEDLDNLRCSARPIRIWTQPDTDLMYCTWEVGRSVIYMGAFDLNQWYSNHTKEHIFYNSYSGLCPFWVALPVEVPDSASFAMDVRIIPKSLMRWENPHAKLDVHLYPASVSFRAICLTNTGVSAFEHFGVQEKLVRIILKDGPSLLIQPESIKNSFMRYGLEPVFPHVYGEHRSKKDQDRFVVLSVLLENRRTPAILRLAGDWLDGSYANVGCTIDLIIDWIAEYMLALRRGADEHWQNLFYFADATLPPETVRFINFSNFAWTSLHRLLLTLMGPSEVYTVRRQELESIEFGLGKLVQYSAALLMMYKAQLLPEQSRSFLNNVTAYYEQRRHEAKVSLETCQYIDEDFKKLHPLMIDHLMDNLMPEEALREKWNVIEGQHLYPPQHIGYLVNLFMLPDVDPKAVSRVFMYFLIDLSFFSQNTGANHVSVVERKVRGDFKAVMDSTAEEYQDIYVLWLQDHGILNEILVHIKENDRLYQKDGLPWCAAAVTLTAAGYENDVAELLLKSCPHDLAKLLFSLMTSSVSKYTSLAELMITSNLNTDEELLQQFFEISETRERLAEFIRTKSKELPGGVKNALLAFLNKSDSVKRLSQLLMFYVHTEDYKTLEEEFARVREFLRHRNLTDSDRKMWRFQETYISHLLNTSKGSVVQQFLRRQSHQTVRSGQATISIRAVPVNDDTLLDDVHCQPQTGTKLPPHFRRLKLSESVVQDPLSPLRRYAGRIQSAVTPTISLESVRDNPIRPGRLSTRKSFSRRVSLSINRHSLVNSSSIICNDTLANEDNLDITSRDCSIDLKSLLKTPSVDHRVETRQIPNIVNLNQTQSQEETEEGTSHPIEPLIHSIMKEVDPSKPKVTKKVELRFENLSLSSEEGDEKNKSIYEDADDNLEFDNSLVNNAFDTSFNSSVEEPSFESTCDKSMWNTDENQESENVKHNVTSSQKDLMAGKKLLDVIEEEDILEQEDSALSEKNTAQNIVGVESELFKTPLPVIPATDNTSSSRDLNLKLPLSQTTVSTEQKIMQITEEEHTESEESEKMKEGSETGTSKSVAATESSPPVLYELDAPPSQTTVSAEQKLMQITEEEHIKTEESEKMKKESETGTSKSVAATESSPPVLYELDAPPSQTTVSAEQKLMQIIEEETTSTENPEKTKTTKKGGKKGSSKTATGTESSPSTILDVTQDNISKEEIEETPIQPESEQGLARNLRRSSRVSRSRTPTREGSSQPDLNDDVEKEPTKRTLRATRSTTPTRETIFEADLDESESVSSRRSTRSTRSKTPTRELEVLIERTPTKTLKRGTRSSTTPSREIVGEEQSKDEDSSKTRSTNKGNKKGVKKSATTTESSGIFEITKEDMEQEEKDEAPLPTTSKKTNKISGGRKRRLTDTDNTSSSSELKLELDEPPSQTTVSADQKLTQVIEDENTSTEKTEKAKTTKKGGKKGSSKSIKSPSAILDVTQDNVKKEEIEETPIQQESEQGLARNLRRSSRVSRSRTPTREGSSQPDLYDDVEKESTRRTLRATRSTTPTRETIFQADLDEAESVSSRRSTRSTRSKTPTRELEVIIERTPTKTLERVTRSSTTPSREITGEEQSKDEDPSETSSTSKGNKKGVKKSAATTESSGIFEITKEDMEQEEEDDAPLPTTSKKTTKISGARKRRLKYLHHYQDLSTVIEDPTIDGSEASVFEATVISAEPKTEVPKRRKIKGIKARHIEEDEAEKEGEPVKPSKRRKPNLLLDFDEDEESEVQSEVSSRSTRSTNSRRSTGSTKTKTTRRKGRSSSKSVS